MRPNIIPWHDAGCYLCTFERRNQQDPRNVNVVPLDDLVEHDLTEDCVCGPRAEFVPGRLVLVHNSLDGRELTE